MACGPRFPPPFDCLYGHPLLIFFWEAKREPIISGYLVCSIEQAPQGRAFPYLVGSPLQLCPQSVFSVVIYSSKDFQQLR